MGYFEPVFACKVGAPREVESYLFSKSSTMMLKDETNGFAKVSRFSLGDAAVGEVVSSGHEVSVSEFNSSTLIVPLNGNLWSESEKGTQQATVGEALFFSPNRRRTGVDKSDKRSFVGIPLIIPVDQLKAAAARLGSSGRAVRKLDNMAVKLSSARSAEASELIQLIRVLHGEISRGSSRLTSPVARGQWLDLIAEKTVEALGVTGAFDLPNVDLGNARHKHARQAMEYMEEHFADIQSIAGVARACGIGSRNLELAFRTVWDISPSKALTVIRLKASRKLLLEGGRGMSVTDVALQCGFSHLGRFSAAYRSRFGETPSRTLQSAGSAQAFEHLADPSYS